MNPPQNPMGKVNAAGRTARRLRAEWLVLLNEQMVTPSDLLLEAEAPNSRPLLKLSLRQILLAQPGWGRARAHRILDHILSVTGASMDRRKITVGWLLDPRAGGRRFAAWLDAFEPKKTPWPGFPFVRSSDV